MTPESLRPTSNESVQSVLLREYTVEDVVRRLQGNSDYARSYVEAVRLEIDALYRERDDKAEALAVAQVELMQARVAQGFVDAAANGYWGLREQKAELVKALHRLLSNVESTSYESAKGDPLYMIRVYGSQIKHLESLLSKFAAVGEVDDA